MLCLMFECQDRGVLSAGGMPWSDEDIAVAIGGDTTANLEWIRELLAKGVAHRNDSGAIFCRRMVRDEQIRKAKSAAGKSGMSNRWDNKEITERITGGVTERGSSSSSSASAENKYPTLKEIQVYGPMVGLTPEQCEAYFNKYQAVGWVDGANRMITSWKHHISSFRELEKTKIAAASRKPSIGQFGGNGGVAINSVAQADSVIKELEKQILKIKEDSSNFTQLVDRPGRVMKQEKLEELNGLKAKLEQMKKLKTGMAVAA